MKIFVTSFLALIGKITENVETNLFSLSGYTEWIEENVDRKNVALFSLDDLYLEDISNLQEMVFQEITRYKFEVDYPKFVSGYMKCKYRRLLDAGNPRIANMTRDELLYYLKKTVEIS